MTLLVLVVSALCELFLLRFIYRLTREMQCGPPDECANSLCSDGGVESGDNFRDEIENEWHTEDAQARGRIHIQRVVIYIPHLRPGVREFGSVRSARSDEANRGLDEAS